MFSGLLIVDVELLRGTVVRTLWLEVRWKDQFLSWNSSDYDNVQFISVDSKDDWLPDLMMLSQRGEVYTIDPESIGCA